MLLHLSLSVEVLFAIRNVLFLLCKQCAASSKGRISCRGCRLVSMRVPVTLRIKSMFSLVSLSTWSLKKIEQVHNIHSIFAWRSDFSLSPSFPFLLRVRPCPSTYWVFSKVVLHRAHAVHVCNLKSGPWLHAGEHSRVMGSTVNLGSCCTIDKR